jgi:hydroxymethylpyrimidine kinase/phosphomethylpyrimidine kinase
MPNVLTIAGTDPTGGAGIQADLKTFAARGVYGMSVVTALVAQNTQGVQDIHSIPTAFIAAQIESVMSDVDTAVWKTGMLASTEVIQLVAEQARRYSVERLVVDPVMVAKSGDPLLQPSARAALISELLPLAYVLTPNHHEAQVLTEMPISTVDDMRRAAAQIHAMGPRYVVVKGGHLPDSSDAIDVLYDGAHYHELSAPRRATRNTHGTGCTFASTIAAELAKGAAIEEAVRTAKAYLTAALAAADDLRVGQGQGPVNHSLGQAVALPVEK